LTRASAVESKLPGPSATEVTTVLPSASPWNGWDGSFACGILADASRQTQHAHASGGFTDIGTSPIAGSAQASSLVLRGETPGHTSHESVVLKFGESCDLEIELDRGKAYAFCVLAIASGRSSNGSPQTQSFRHLYTVLPGGILSTESWTESIPVAPFLLTASVTGWPPVFRLTFNCEYSDFPCRSRCVANVSFTEVIAL